MLALASSLVLAGKIVGWIICAGIFASGLWWWYCRSDDRRLLLIKWGFSLPGFVAAFFLFRWLDRAIGNGLDYGAAFFGGTLTAALGLYFAIIWRRNIAMMVARPFGSLYDGGSQEIEPQAYYSLAEAKRKRGNYDEAIAEIRKQLEKFPADFAGTMMLAEIQAENLHDLPTAVMTVRRLAWQPKQTPANIAYALNTLADWQLKLAADPDAAREALQQIVQMLPDSEFALMAEQRIAHLATPAQLAAAHDRPRIHVPQGVQNIGLLHSSAYLAPSAPDQTARAGELVAQLQAHPQDSEAREELAIIYADHYQRLDLAAEQLGQLINQPNRPTRSVIHWLNLLADLQIRHGSPYEAVHQTLSEIIDRYPDNPAANLARNRLDILRLEIKAKTAAPAVKLGTYEQNLGLKAGGRSRPGQ